MSFRVHMKGYDDLRMLHQIDSLHAWKHEMYFPPVLVEISPTSRCNQLCRYCYTNKRIEAQETLSDDVLVNVFGQLADAGVRAVLVQGTGEPLLHPALPDAIAAGAKRDIAVSLCTNGVLLKESVRDRILEHLFHIRFSVLDSNPQRYSYLHGCPESQWEAVTNNLKGVVAFRARQDLQLAVCITVYLYKENFRSLYDIVQFYKELGVDYIYVQEAVYTQNSPCGKEVSASKAFSTAEIDEMKAKVDTLNDDDCRVKVRFPYADDALYKDNWKRDYCQGIKFLSLISSDGGVYPCWRTWGKTEFRYGSLYENTFEEIWKSKRHKQIEELVLNTAPCGDECANCNAPKVNQILADYRNATSCWKDFIV